MIQEIQKLLDDYSAWLKDKTQLRQVDQWVEITTPYLDRHNDCIRIYASKSKGGYTLTDDGYVISDLEMSGCKLNSPKRQELLRTTLNGFGVRTVDQRLEVHATPGNFALRKHNLLQALLAVNDMFQLAVPMVASLFYEDVVVWLDLQGIRYTPRVKFTGQSGFDHLFDFVIPKSRAQPERILQAINRPSRETAQALTFAWIDTKEVRSAESQAYAILNDSEREAPSLFADAFAAYGVRTIPWSQRDAAARELSA